MTFRLRGMVTVSAYTIVEADTLEQAIDEARDRSAVFGDRRSGAMPEEEWVCEEADGMAFDIEEEKAP